MVEYNSTSGVMLTRWLEGDVLNANTFVKEVLYPCSVSTLNCLGFQAINEVAEECSHLCTQLLLWSTKHNSFWGWGKTQCWHQSVVVGKATIRMVSGHVDIGWPRNTADSLKADWSAVDFTVSFYFNFWDLLCQILSVSCLFALLHSFEDTCARLFKLAVCSHCCIVLKTQQCNDMDEGRLKTARVVGRYVHCLRDGLC